LRKVKRLRDEINVAVLHFFFQFSYIPNLMRIQITRIIEIFQMHQK